MEDPRARSVPSPRAGVRREAAVVVAFALIASAAVLLIDFLLGR
jgi:preprotein translocase subunit SecE